MLTHVIFESLVNILRGISKSELCFINLDIYLWVRLRNEPSSTANFINSQSVTSCFSLTVGFYNIKNTNNAGKNKINKKNESETFFHCFFIACSRHFTFAFTTFTTALILNSKSNKLNCRRLQQHNNSDNSTKH